MSGACGECTRCCHVLEVTEIRKPYCTDCKFLDKGGCGIYESRPEECRAFECLWLQLSRSNAPLHKRMRPDKCGVMFTAMDPNTIAAHCESELSLDSYPVRGYVKRWLKNGLRIVRIVGDKRTLIAWTLHGKPL